jgi:hypothetical protein
MSWLYSQALVEEYLGANFLDGEQSVPSSGNPIQQAYCAPDKMTVFSRLSRFGMTFKPLTDIRGEELSMSSVVAFHVRTLVRQEKVTDLTENEAECGRTWRAWLAKFDPDSCSWKTPQCSLLGEEPESLQTLPRWGMTVDGLLWEQQTLEPITRGTEFGLLERWATPTTMDTLPPKSDKALEKEATQVRPGRAKPANLRDQVSNMHKWASPNARDWKDSGTTQGNRKSPNLGTQVHWPTPRTAGMCGGTGSWELLNKNTTIEEARLMGAGNGGKLNPTWVEWLMGWPLGWTDLKPLATDKSLSVQQKHGDC